MIRNFVIRNDTTGTKQWEMKRGIPVRRGLLDEQNVLEDNGNDGVNVTLSSIRQLENIKNKIVLLLADLVPGTVRAK